EYLRVALEVGQHFHDRFVRAGLTTGGPPDALQCPDSQSATALLESFVVLYEVTGDAGWIPRATDIAQQVASWIVSYDFPRRAPVATGAGGESEIQTTGAVFANASGRVGSPGFFVQSGDALFKLYRATGNISYLELLRDTTHNLTQYSVPADGPGVRAPEPPASVAPVPVIHRVDSSAWMSATGEVVPASVPLQVCSMLAYLEVPGVYVQPNTAFVFVIDHVTVAIKEKTAVRLVLTIKNPTKLEASVRVVAEHSVDMTKPLGLSALFSAPLVVLAPGEEQDVVFAREPA
ncbi:MAG TPA: hypothetical protein VFH73_28325, partial [Polyangia bacterium]|nr:hypothetical protein [Polyangia bacterium]